jgi:prepilin-type N-terminal cleavage/methylation domain-containing protein
MKSQKGFSLVEILIVLGVIVLLVGVGYVGWKAFTKTNETAAETATSSSSLQSAEVITTKADLEAAEKALDDLDFEDDSVAEAETQANL